MAHFLGLDVSAKETSVCVVDDAGKVLCEREVPTESDDIAALLTSIGGEHFRDGLAEAGVRRDTAHEGLADGAEDQQIRS